MKYMGVGIIVNLVWVTFIDNESINLIVFVIITSSGRPFYSIIQPIFILINNFLHDILKTVIVLTRRNINAEPIFAMIFTVKFVLFIRTMNIQT